MVRQSAVRVGVCSGARSHLNIILVNHGVTEVWNWTGLVACVPDFQEGRWSSPLFSGQNYVHYQPIKHKTREHWPLDPEDRNSLALTLWPWKYGDIQTALITIPGALDPFGRMALFWPINLWAYPWISSIPLEIERLLLKPEGGRGEMTSIIYTFLWMIFARCPVEKADSSGLQGDISCRQVESWGQASLGVPRFMY